MRRRGRPAGPTGPVLSRALTLLDSFSSSRPALTLTQLATLSGMPLSTAHRLVGELVTWGALERADDATYRIGLRLWELGSLAPRGQALRERALPFLEDLSQISRENVQLAVREGTELVFVERIAGFGAVPVFTRVGGRFAMTATGVGLVLLAHAPLDVQDDVLGGRIDRYTEKTVTDPAPLRTMLAHVRMNGFSISERQVSMDTLSVGAPIYDHRGLESSLRCPLSSATERRRPTRWRRSSAPARRRSAVRSPNGTDPDFHLSEGRFYQRMVPHILGVPRRGSSGRPPVASPRAEAADNGVLP